ncbi:Hydrogen cyanide synthase subunit HcnC precursor [Caulifigura coniformis]|uniref:Hydrogen cyanide synthase subunit HcnC n=1 Tax=Caulifigura coniformis TaxID=2527983 RepID=A0A517SGN4_9PLAN|nr:glycine oxidase ThiO [Caulifigura coniformis]QDT55281.1 Hydrogen cyanide synthase subunit HcnC precursor [Caulifigura coniformis]
MSDVVIIGGGVMGLTTAWELAKAGRTVEVIDQSELGQEASWAGAGLLPPGHRGDPNDPLVPLLRRATEMWPVISRELKEESGVDNGFEPCPEIQILKPGQSVDAEMREWIVNGVKAEALSEQRIRELEPMVAEGLGAGFLLPDGTQVRNPWHMHALEAACRKRGVRLTTNRKVTGFEARGGRVHSVTTAAGPVSGDQFLVAGGAWSGEILKSVGIPLEIEPVRGQMVLFRTPKRQLRHTVEIGKQYVVPRSDGRVLAGSTEEWVGFVKENTEQGVRGLIEFAHRLVPSLKQAEVEKTWAGFRPHARRGQPYLGAAPGYDNLFIAAGHFRAGLHLSPVTARLMKQRMTGESTELPLDAFAIG